MMRFCRRSLFPEKSACGVIRKKWVQKRRKIRFSEENWLYFLNGWFLWPASAGKFCRTALRPLDSGSLICLASLEIEKFAFPHDQVGHFCALLVIFGYFSLRRNSFSAPIVEQKIVADVMARS